MTPLTTKAAEIRAGLVKPLEWMSDREPFFATSPFCMYRIASIKNDTGAHWETTITNQGSMYKRAETEAEAKSAAQSDYEARILSALNLDLIEQQAAELADEKGARETAERGGELILADLEQAKAELAEARAENERVKSRSAEIWDDLLDLKAIEADTRAKLTTTESERDSWRRVCERLETEKQAALAERDELLREKERLGALEAALSGMVRHAHETRGKAVEDAYAAARAALPRGPAALAPLGEE